MNSAKNVTSKQQGVNDTDFCRIRPFKKKFIRDIYTIYLSLKLIYDGIRF